MKISDNEHSIKDAHFFIPQIHQLFCYFAAKCFRIVSEKFQAYGNLQTCVSVCQKRWHFPGDHPDASQTQEKTDQN